MHTPSYHQLLKEQKDIVKQIARNQQDIFVEGPPGSGKTLISLYALQDIIEKTTVTPLLLMYNFSLYGYLKTAVSSLDLTDNVTIATKDKFFWDLARLHNIVAKNKNNYEAKYNFLLTELLNVRLDKSYDITIVDEVQDLNPKEWILIKRLSKRVSSLGDFNQGIFETKLKKDDIIGEGLYGKLTKIHRFHKKIAKIASKFSRTHENLEAMVVKVSQINPKVINTTSDSEHYQIKQILYSLQNMHKSIGIICPDRGLLGSLSMYLSENKLEHDYLTENKNFKYYDFNSTKPLLITSYSAKGLEFENVILFGFNNTSSMVQKLKKENRLKDVIYVSITRTNNRLFILNNEDTVDVLKNIKVEEETKTNSQLDDWL